MPAASTAERFPLSLAGLLIVIGGVMVLVGLFLPWAVVGRLGTVAGFDEMRLGIAVVLCAAVGIVAGGTILAGRRWRPAPVVALAAAFATLGGVVTTFFAARNLVVWGSEHGFELGPGGYVAIAGAVVMMVGALWGGGRRPYA